MNNGHITSTICGRYQKSGSNSLERGIKTDLETWKASGTYSVICKSYSMMPNWTNMQSSATILPRCIILYMLDMSDIRNDFLNWCTVVIHA